MALFGWGYKNGHEKLSGPGQALIKACEAGDAQAAKAALAAGASLEPEGEFAPWPLEEAARAAGKDGGATVEALVAAGAKMEAPWARPRRHGALLELAVEAGSERACAALLGAGAAKLLRSGLGCPLEAAARKRAPNLARMLLEAGVAPNGIRERGASDWSMRPLHWAAMFTDAQTARLLIEAGADPMRRSPTGGTPLHEFADRGGRGRGPGDAARVVSLLLEAGGDVLARDSRGRSALEALASRRKVEDLGEALEALLEPTLARGKRRALKKAMEAAWRQKAPELADRLACALGPADRYARMFWEQKAAGGGDGPPQRWPGFEGLLERAKLEAALDGEGLAGASAARRRPGGPRL